MPSKTYLIFIILVFSLSCSLIPKKSSSKNAPSRKIADIIGDDDRFSSENSQYFKTKLALSTAVLSEFNEQYPEGRNYCSGTIFKYQNEKYLITNEHCLYSQEQCLRTKVVQNYDDYSLRRQFERENPGKRYTPAPYIVPTKFPIELLNSPENPVYQCKNLILKNYLLDFAVAKISSPLNGVSQNESSLVAVDLKNDTLDRLKENSSLVVFGHPEGTPLRVSQNCESEEINLISGRGAREYYSIIMDCDILKGNSGGMVLDVNSNKFYGITASGLDGHVDNVNLNSLFFSSGNAFVNFTLIKPHLIKFLDGDEEVKQNGIWSENRSFWTSLNGQYSFDVFDRYGGDEYFSQIAQLKTRILTILIEQHSSDEIQNISIALGSDFCTTNICDSDMDEVITQKLNRFLEITNKREPKRKTL